MTSGGRARSVAASMAAGLGLLANPAQAADSHTILVNAVLLSKSSCQFINKNSLVSLTIDPAATSSVSATGTVSFKCGGTAATASYGVSNNNGQNGSSPTALRMRHSTTLTQYMNYSLSYPISGTAPKNVDTTFTVTVSVAPADFQNVIPGSYADTVMLTIVP